MPPWWTLEMALFGIVALAFVGMWIIDWLNRDQK